MASLSIDVWSDVACPWCWIGKRHLERALAEWDGAAVVRWRAFELHPGAPAETAPGTGYADRLAAKYGTSPDDARDMIERMVQAGAERGLELRFDRIRPGSTFDAHRLLAWAGEHGPALQERVAEGLFRAYLTEGRLVAARGTLVDVARAAGLAADGAEEMLDGPTFEAEVRRDEAIAAEVGITAVPFFVIEGRFAVQGAQPPEVLVRALGHAARSLESAGGPESATSAPAVASEATCGPAGCDVPNERS